ncbi:MAG: hypothetical protein ACPGN3_14640, partial [Opitutales bacterium]
NFRNRCGGQRTDRPTHPNAIIELLRNMTSIDVTEWRWLSKSRPLVRPTRRNESTYAGSALSALLHKLRRLYDAGY